MIREYGSLLGTALRGLDLTLVALGGMLAGWLYLEAAHEAANYPAAIALGALLAFALFPAFGIYRKWRGASLGEELHAIAVGSAVLFAALSTIAFVTKTGQFYSRGWFILWAANTVVLLGASRIALRLLLRELRRRGWNQRRVLIVGAGASSAEVVERLRAANWTGLEIRQTLDIAACVRELAADEDYLGRLTTTAAIDEVWVILPLREEATLSAIQRALRYSTADLRYVPDVSSFALLNHSISDIAGVPVINLSASGMDNVDHLGKAVEDRLLALLILVIGAPLLLAIAIGVKLSSPGPVLFRQKRAGLGGQTITVLKFRSMVVHSEASGQLTQARRDDPRVTRFGAFLRRTSLDELPQFFNVLRGEMSIVGPRPHALEHNEHYKELVDRYMSRHKIKPGITGWAQINGCRGETDTVDKMRRRIELDLYYIEHWSIWFDLKIIALTVWRELFRARAY